MTTTAFRFSFSAESNPQQAIPFVARLSWNPVTRRVGRTLVALPRQDVSPLLIRIAGEFEASPGEIIEARKGVLKRRGRETDLRAWYLVAPTGYLVLVAEADHTEAQRRVERYLAGSASVHTLGTWSLAHVTSAWRARHLSDDALRALQRDALLAQRAELLSQIEAIDAQLARHAEPSRA
jgi:hypothetical protein